jgi:ubiquinone biosynthesis protein
MVIERILVATDRSDTATRAVEWAAEMADRYSAELLLLQVVAPEHVIAGASDGTPAADDLRQFAQRLAGGRARARLEYDSDPAQTIVRVADEERADVVVVGNRGMRERTEFLLGSVPNRVSHNAHCHVVIVNTAGAAAWRGARRPPDESRGGAEPDEGELLGRAARIARVVARHGLGGVLRRGDDRDPAAAQARRLRETLEELGPTFAKLGQILSTRADLLPAPFIEELADLQDHVRPLTEAEVVATMEKELRVPWEDVFESLEPDPMAAGTIAQVHRAVLVGGERVVVKVQRPSAEADIMQDLGLLERFAEKAERRPAFRQVVDVPAIIEHLSSSLRRELDFRHEAANIERMRAVLAPFDRLDVPRVHTDLSTARLLVMQEVQGVPVREAPEGEARRAAGRQLLEAYYQQVLAEGFFHADPHPGNLMWWNDTIYLLDLGMVGEVDPELRQSLMLLLLAFWQEDSAFLADLMLGMSSERPHRAFDPTAFREELAALVARYRHLSLRELRLGPLLQQITEISVRHHVRLPAALALVGKAFGQMQSTAAELDPTLDPFSVAEAFYVRRLAAHLRASTQPRQLFYEAQKLRVRAGRLLEGVERTMGLRPGGGLQVDQRGVDELHDAIGRAGRRLAVGVTAATALIATAVTSTATHAAAWTTPTFGTAAALLTGGLLVDILRRR